MAGIRQGVSTYYLGCVTFYHFTVVGTTLIEVSLISMLGVEWIAATIVGASVLFVTFFWFKFAARERLGN